MKIDTALIQEQLHGLLTNPGLLQNIVKTLILLIILLILKKIFNRNVETWKELSMETRRRLVVGARNFTVILFVIGNFFIWGPQIREFALGVAAVAIAFVMVFKEVIANFMGGVSRAISQQYTIGDRIKIGELRGDVIDSDMLTTTLLEIGPGNQLHQYTGSSITFPNTLLLTTPVLNESFMHEYLLHVFKVPVSLNSDWKRKEKCLIQAAKLITEPYLNKARIYMNAASHKISVEPPAAEPRISLIFTKPDEMDFLVRVPVPMRSKGRVEQEILRKYLELLEKDDDNVYKDEGSD